MVAGCDQHEPGATIGRPGERTFFMRKTLWVVAIALAALTCAPAIANAHDWSGFYVGLNAGAISNRDTGQETCYNPSGVKNGPGCPVPTGAGNMNGSGFLGGLQLGWNWQLGPLVFGPEFDYDGSTMQQSSNWQGQLVPGYAPATFSATENLSSLQTERLRIGFASHDTYLYATGGWAQGVVTESVNLTCYGVCGAPTVSAAGQNTISDSGWAEGIGGEWAVGHHMTMKLEGLLYTLRPYSPEYPVSSGVGYSFGKDFYFHGAIARLGINWRL
jgi:outer membrane immunogenic protein